MPISAVDSALGTVNQSPDTGSGIAQIPSGIQAGMQLAQKAQALQLQQQEIEFTKQRIESAKDDHEMGLWRLYHESQDDPDAQRAIGNDIVGFRKQRGKDTNADLVKMMGKSTILMATTGSLLKMYDDPNPQTRAAAFDQINGAAAGTVSQALTLAKEFKRVQLQQKMMGYKAIKDSATTGADVAKLAQLKAQADQSQDPNDIQAYQDELAKQNAGSFKGQAADVARQNAATRAQSVGNAASRIQESQTKGKTSAVMSLEKPLEPIWKAAQQAEKDMELLDGKQVLVRDAREAMAGVNRLILQQNRIATSAEDQMMFKDQMSRLNNIRDEYANRSETATIDPAEVKILQNRISRLAGASINNLRSAHERSLRDLQTTGRFNDNEADRLRESREQRIGQLKHFNSADTISPVTQSSLLRQAKDAIYSGANADRVRAEYINQMKKQFGTDVAPDKVGF